MADLTLVPPIPQPAPAKPAFSLPKATKPTPKDRRRYAMIRRGHSIEEVAGIEKVSVETINKSLLVMTMYQDAYSHESIEFATNEVFLSKLDAISTTLDEAMKAQRPNQQGVMEADHDMRLKAIQTAKSLLDSIRPKGGGVNVNVQQNNNVNPSNGPARGGFEGIVRRLEERRQAQATPVEIVQDAEFEEIDDEVYDTEPEVIEPAHTQETPGT